MAVLSRDQILAAKPPFVMIPVPHWGGDVRISGISIVQRNRLVEEYNANFNAFRLYEEDQARPEGERQNVPKVDLIDIRALTMVNAITGEDGNPLFTLDDLGLLLDKLDQVTLAKLWEAFETLNNVPTIETVDAKKKPSAKTNTK